MEFLVMFMVIVYTFSVALNIYLTVKWIKRYSSRFMKIIGVFLGITATFSFITMILQALPVYIPHVDYISLVGILSITILMLLDLNELQKTV